MKTTTFAPLNKLLRVCALLILAIAPGISANGQCNFAPVFTSAQACGTVINAIAGVPLFLSIQTSDPDGGNIVLTLSSGALPAGSATSPPLPETDNPPSTVFTWTPTAAQAGQHTVTFTVTDDCNEETSCTYTIDVAPVQCVFTTYAFTGSLAACNDNGTPGDPSDDFFFKNLQVQFFNRPATGSMQIVPGGDAIGTYSVPVSSLTGSFHNFNNVKFKADGTPTEVQVNFTDEPTCLLNATGQTVQSCSSAPDPCATNVEPVFLAPIPSCPVFLSVLPGVPVSFTINVADADVGDIVTLNGLNIPAGATLSNPLPAIGNSVTTTFDWTPGVGDVGLHTVTFFFDDLCDEGSGCDYIIDVIDPCTINIEPVFLAPIPSCPVYLSVLPGVPVSFTINVADADVGDIVTLNGLNIPAGATLSNPLPVIGNSVTTTFDWTPGVGDVGLHTVTFFFDDLCDEGSGCDYIIDVQPSIQPIINLTCPAPVTVSCAGDVPPANPAAVSETHTCAGTVSITHAGDVITNQVCANRYTITRTYEVSDQCGQSATCSQIITVNDELVPVITCAANTTLGCGGIASFTPPTTVYDDCGESGLSLVQLGTTETINSDGSKTHTRTWRATDACDNTATCSQSVTVPICEEHCSNGQGFYGSQNGLSCTGLTASQSIDLALQGGAIAIGCNARTLTVNPGQAACVVQKMPGGSTPAALPNGNVTCATATGNNYLKNGKFKSVLLAQTLAMSFNLRLDNTLGALQVSNNYFSTYAATSCTNGAPIAGTKQVFYIPQSVRNCIGAGGTVNDLLVLANKALGGGNGVCATGCNATLGEITQALDAINSGFNKCRILGYFASSPGALRISNEMPAEFATGIELNVYPNPTSENATVEFVVAESGNAVVELFDITGARIATIFNGPVERDEVYSATLNAGNLPSGIYLCRYISDDASSTIRVVVMK